MPKTSRKSKASAIATVSTTVSATRRTTRSQSQIPGAAPLADKLPTPKRKPTKKSSKKSTNRGPESDAAAAAPNPAAPEAPPEPTPNVISSGASYDSGLGLTESQNVTDVEHTETEHTETEQTDAEPSEADANEELRESVDQSDDDRTVLAPVAAAHALGGRVIGNERVVTPAGESLPMSKTPSNLHEQPAAGQVPAASADAGNAAAVLDSGSAHAFTQGREDEVLEMEQTRSAPEYPAWTPTPSGNRSPSPTDFLSVLKSTRTPPRGPSPAIGAMVSAGVQAHPPHHRSFRYSEEQMAGLTRLELVTAINSQNNYIDVLESRCVEMLRSVEFWRRRAENGPEGPSVLGKRPAENGEGGEHEESATEHDAKRLKQAEKPVSASSPPAMHPSVRKVYVKFHPADARSDGHSARRRERTSRARQRAPGSPSPAPGIAPSGISANGVEKSNASSENQNNQVTSTPGGEPRTPPTPATALWGLRSLWGSVSKFMPGSRSNANTVAATEVPASPTPSTTPVTQPPSSQSQARSNNQPSNELEESNAPTKATKNVVTATPKQSVSSAAPEKKSVRRDGRSVTARLSEPTVGHKRRRQLTPNRRKGPGKSAIMETAEHDAQRDKLQKLRDQVDPSQPKKVKIPVDALPDIPTRGPRDDGGTYGMLDDFFTYDSDSADEVELWDNEVPWDQLLPLQTNKKQRTTSKPRGDTNDRPMFAAMPEAIANASSSFSPQNVDPAHARPYSGKIFADATDATTYKGGNVFDQSVRFSSTDLPNFKAIDPVSKSQASTSHQPDPKIAEQVRKYGHSNEYDPNFNWSGHFRVPEGSDSEDESTEIGEIESPQSVQGTPVHASKSSGASKKVEKTDISSQIPGRKEPATILSATSDGKTSSPRGQTTERRVARPHERAKASGEQQNTQPPPPPTPAHASLPKSQSTQNVPAPNAEALARARSQAEKYKPKQPSGLRASSRLSASSVGSENVEDAAKLANTVGATPSSIGGVLNQPVAPAAKAVSGLGNVFERSQNTAHVTDNELSQATSQTVSDTPRAAVNPFVFPSATPIVRDPLVAVAIEEATAGLDFAQKALDNFQKGFNAWMASGGPAATKLPLTA